MAASLNPSGSIPRAEVRAAAGHDPPVFRYERGAGREQGGIGRILGRRTVHVGRREAEAALVEQDHIAGRAECIEEGPEGRNRRDQARGDSRPAHQEDRRGSGLGRDALQAIEPQADRGAAGHPTPLGHREPADLDLVLPAVVGAEGERFPADPRFLSVTLGHQEV